MVKREVTKGKATREEVIVKWIKDRNIELTQAKEVSEQFDVTLSYSRSLLTRIYKHNMYSE